MGVYPRRGLVGIVSKALDAVRGPLSGGAAVLAGC
jgi:hypothetical protein